MQRGHSPRIAAVGLPAALLLAPLLALGTPVPADAASAVILAPGKVVVASPGANLTTPTDGRLRGTDFTASVTGVAWPASVLSQGITRVAGSGRRLVVFSLRLSQPGDDVGPFAQSTTAVATVAVAGQQLPVDLTVLDDQIEAAGTAEGTGTESFVMSVPARTHDVVLSLSEAGFSQRFDLWTLKRLSPTPAVLYRDPTASSVTTTASATALLPTTNPADGYSNPARLTLKGATLTYFAPDGSGTTPSGPTAAYLVADLTASPNGPPFTSPNWGHFFSTLTTLPGDQLTFTPTGGTPVAATTAPLATTPGLPTGDDGLFNAQYWFTVPATTTTGTITVPAGTVPGTEYLGFTATQKSVPLDLPTTATLTVTFPAVPSPPPAQRTPPWVGAPLPATGATVTGTAVASATGATGSGGGGFPIWLAIVLVVLLAVAVFVTERVLRRRRQLAALPGEGTLPLESVALGSPEVPTTPGPTVAPTLGGPDDLVVRMLGPVEITGWIFTPERRGVIEELCCYLALRPDRSFSTADLLAALWPVGGDRSEVTPKTAYNYLSALRRAVGANHLPDAVTSGGYQLAGAITDWDRFTSLCHEADGLDDHRGDELRAEALSLVRGTPFSGAAGTQYGWAFAGSVATTMTVAIAQCAHRLAQDRLVQGDPVRSEHAARCGIRGAPDDERLWRDVCVAARASGDRAAEARAWRDLTAALGAQRADELRHDLEV